MKINAGSLIFRVSICAFWLMLIISFLILPHIFSVFRQERSLTIFTWPLMLDPIYLKKFEKETGIKLHITYYDSSAALLNKLEAGKGKGYDLVIADDRTLELIIKKSLAKPIEQQRLSFWKDINPWLLNNYYDPKNRYTIPHYWGAYGIGYDRSYFGKEIPPATWGLLFDKNLCPPKICMTDDPREAIMISAQYLFGSIEVLKDKKSLKKIEELLIEQKKHIEVYTISRADNLLQIHSCSVAGIMSSDINRLNKEHSHVGFLTPEEGSFLIIDAFVIPRASEKDELIYEFLNYLYTPDVIAHHTDAFGYCSPLVSASSGQHLCPNGPFKGYDFFRNIIPDSEINDVWVRVLAA